uniref:TsaA-like domain-containing protein n=1 Tax=Biomphalaria glabrata TaxID=6526 RepID=A0A2C9JMI1_BIOGL
MDSCFKMKPIGTLKSVFHYKNGIPRQSSLCQAARGVLTIEKCVFNNPEHSLQGLEEFSHAWIIFVFHKNNNTYTKAKVKPPRLDGLKVGVFSTRSPYRPNNIGLSLVKIDKVVGSSVYISGIDLLDGTPVLDIKPYIPDYDSPRNLLPHEDSTSTDEITPLNDQHLKSLELATDAPCSDKSEHDQAISKQTSPANTDAQRGTNSVESGNSSNIQPKSELNHHMVTEGFYQLSGALKKVGEALESSLTPKEDNGCPSEKLNEDSDLSQILNLSLGTEIHDILSTKANNTVSDNSMNHRSSSHSKKVNIEKLLSIGGDSSQNITSSVKFKKDNSEILQHKTSMVAPWLTNPPVSKLKVLFTPRALEQLGKFCQSSPDESYKLQMLLDVSEAERSISEILSEEPRSVYRRQHCQDSLYYFTLDVLHVTCWFDDDQVEVVRIKPITLVPKLKQNSNGDSS